MVAEVILGIASGAAWDATKLALEKISDKSWRDLYVESFEEALLNLRPQLLKYTDNGNVDINRDALNRALEQDLGDPERKRFAELGSEEYLSKLVAIFRKNEVLILGGHELSEQDYEQLIQNFVGEARAAFIQVILRDEQGFRRALLEETSHNQSLLDEVAFQVNRLISREREEHGETRQLILGVGGRQSERFDEIVRRQDILLDKLEPPPLSTSAVLQGFRHANSELRRYPTTTAGLYIRRPEVDQILAWLTTAPSSNAPDSVGVVLDQPGAGKTVVMQQVLSRLEARDIPVVAIKADFLSGVASRAALSEHLNLPGDLAACVREVAKESPVVVLVDQVDALSLTFARDQTLLGIVLSLIAELRAIPNVRILASCRQFDLNFDPRLSRLSPHKEFRIGLFSEEQVAHVLDALGVDAKKLLPSHVNLLKTPQNLAVYAKLVSQAETPETEAFQTLQDLYDALWRQQVSSPQPLRLPPSERSKAIYALVNVMGDKRRPTLTAPESTLDAHLEAANYLLSIDFIRREGRNFLFSHQTLFDYCFARRFFSDKISLSETILGSPQGLFERSQMVQLLAYIRGTDRATYLKELKALLFSPDLRPHLRYLLIEWLAALPDPSDDEKRVAARLIHYDDEGRRRFLPDSAANPSWFVWARRTVLPDLLASGNEAEVQVALSCLSLAMNSSTEEVVSLLRPYLGSSADWDLRIFYCMKQISDWHNGEALTLLEDLVARDVPTRHTQDLFFFHDLFKTNPEAACRILRVYLDRQLELHEQEVSSNGSEEDAHSGFSFRDSWVDKAFGALHVHEELTGLARDMPETFIDELLPWFLRALALQTSLTGSDDHYPHNFAFDPLIYNNDTSEANFFTQQLAKAVARLARSQRAKFRGLASVLAQVDSFAAQRVLVEGYLGDPDEYAEDILVYLMADRRRWSIGYSDSTRYDSARLFSAAFERLDKEKRQELESFLYGFYVDFELRDPKSRGISQLPFWLSVPLESLTERGRLRRLELERKFPGYDFTPRGIRGGAVGPPIPPAGLQKMADDEWLGAMRRYDDSTGWDRPRREFLKGGLVELSRAFEARVKEDPERFRRLAYRFDEGISQEYVAAAISGLAESSAPAEHLFALVRHFRPRLSTGIRRPVCWAFRKRAEDGVPDDLIELMADWALNDPDPEGDTWQATKGTSSASYGNDPFHHGLNCNRGAALLAASHCALSRQPAQAARVLDLLQRAAGDRTTSVRAMVIRVLPSLTGNDREAVADLFERTVEGHEVLLEGPATQNLLDILGQADFGRARPYVAKLLASPADDTRIAGAQVVCLAAFSDEAAVAYVADIMEGDDQHRLGAARIFSRNLENPECEAVCMEQLMKLMNDPSKEVRAAVGETFAYLRGEHLFRLYGFIESFVNSAALEENPYNLIKFLLNTADAPELTLRCVERLIPSSNKRDLDSRSKRRLADRELVDLVLAVYMQSSKAEEQAEAIKHFETLLALGDYGAVKALEQWDRR